MMCASGVPPPPPHAATSAYEPNKANQVNFFMSIPYLSSRPRVSRVGITVPQACPKKSLAFILVRHLLVNLLPLADDRAMTTRRLVFATVLVTVLGRQTSADAAAC